MATFWTIIQDIRKNSYTERDKGTRFERLIRNYLKTSKKYEILLEEVWLWNEFPYRRAFGGSDTGIDLVALTKDGQYWAIQCKCYAENTVIDKAAVDSSSRHHLVSLLMIIWKSKALAVVYGLQLTINGVKMLRKPLKIKIHLLISSIRGKLQKMKLLTGMN